MTQCRLSGEQAMIALESDTQTMLDRLLQLPTPQRIAVAMALWDSIADADKPIRPDVEDEDAFYEELMRRDAEMEAGEVIELTHEEVMAELRKDLECDSVITPEQSEN
jgi:putative addiction module component (TIGR02574 family)